MNKLETVDDVLNYDMTAEQKRAAIVISALRGKTIKCQDLADLVGIHPSLLHVVLDQAGVEVK